MILTPSLQAHLRSHSNSLVNRYTDWDLFRSHIAEARGHHFPIQDILALEYAGTLQEAARSSTPSHYHLSIQSSQYILNCPGNATKCVNAGNRHALLVRYANSTSVMLKCGMDFVKVAIPLSTIF